MRRSRAVPLQALIAAQMTDTITSLALHSLGLPPPTGASVNISTEFVRPAGKVGDEVTAVGEVVKLGRTLAYTKITLYDAKGRVSGFGSHTKHMGEAKATVRFSEDGETELPLEDKAKL